MRIQNEAGYYLMVELQGRVELDAQSAGYGHFHPFWELIWTDTPVLLCCGRQCISTCGALIPAGAQHRVMGAGCAANMLYLGFRFSDAVNADLTQPLPLPDDPVIAQSCTALLQAPQDAFLAAHTQVLGLLSSVVQSLPERPAPREDALAEKVKRLCDPYHSYTVRQMADMLYVSPSHLGNSFFESTGMHIKKYQALVRLEEALRLLVSTDMSVADIAAQLGFSGTSYFIRCFEQRYHSTPGAMRNALVRQKDDFSMEENER